MLLLERAVRYASEYLDPDTYPKVAGCAANIIHGDCNIADTGKAKMSFQCHPEELKYSTAQEEERRHFRMLCRE